MQGEYIKEGARSYLRLPLDGFPEDSRRERENEKRMICRGKIPGLLPASSKILNGEEYLYYEIASMVRLEDLFLKKKLDRERLNGLMEKLCRQEKRLREFLLSNTRLLYDPGLIYTDLSTGELYFVLFPGLTEEPEEQYGRLVEFFINSADYEDQKLIEAVYSFYDLVMSKSFSAERGMELLEKLGVSPGEEPGTEAVRERPPVRPAVTAEKEDKPTEPTEPTEPIKPIKQIKPIKPINSVSEVPEYFEEAPHSTNEGNIFIKALKYMFVPVTLLEIFFAYVLVNVALNRQELILLGAGAFSAATVAVICRLLAKRLERDELSEDAGVLEEFSEEMSGDGGFSEGYSKGSLRDDGFSEEFSEGISGNAGFSEGYSKGSLRDDRFSGDAGLSEGSSESTGFSKGSWGSSSQELSFSSRKETDAESLAGFFESGALFSGQQASLFSEKKIGQTEYFEQSNRMEKKLYGLGKNRRVIHLENLPFVVGDSKEHADYLLQDSSISRMHAKFTERDGKIYLTDLNSTNGTFKNGLRLMPGEEALLEREDEIRMGRLEFAFR